MKKKLKFIVPVPILLGVLFAAYTMLLAPKTATRKAEDRGHAPAADEPVHRQPGRRAGSAKLSVSLLLSKAPPRRPPVCRSRCRRTPLCARSSPTS